MRAAVAMVALFFLPLAASPDSLDEAARKEAQRRAKNRAAGVKAPTYRDGDVRTHPAEESGAPAALPSPAASPAPDDARVRAELAREGERRKREEQAWRQRAAAIRDQMDDAQRFLSADDSQRLKLSGG
jgi:hypothetical protein